MKRKLLIEVDCEDTCCGGCHLADRDHSVNHSCYVTNEYTGVGVDYELDVRGPMCLENEKLAKALLEKG